MPRSTKKKVTAPAKESAVAKKAVPSPPEKLIKRVGEMLDNLSLRKEHLEVYGKVSPYGIDHFLGGLEDLTILLQRAHTKQVWEEDEKVWDHMDPLKIILEKGNHVQVSIGRECSEYGEEGDPDEYDVDEEPKFCAVDENYLWCHNANVHTTTTGTTADFYPYGYGKFMFHGSNPKSRGRRGFTHHPGDRCASQVCRTSGWDA